MVLNNLGPLNKTYLKYELQTLCAQNVNQKLTWVKNELYCHSISIPSQPKECQTFIVKPNKVYLEFPFSFL